MAILLVADDRDPGVLAPVQTWLQRRFPLVPVLDALSSGVQPDHAEIVIPVGSIRSFQMAVHHTSSNIDSDVPPNVWALAERMGWWVPGTIVVTDERLTGERRARLDLLEMANASGLKEMGRIWEVYVVGGKVADDMSSGISEVFEMDKAAAHDVRDLLNLPFFVTAAGSRQAAEALLSTAVYSRSQAETDVLGDFLTLFNAVLEVWSLDAATTWLRSANAFLDGARPLQYFALNNDGMSQVTDALDADRSFVYA